MGHFCNEHLQSQNKAAAFTIHRSSLGMVPLRNFPVVRAEQAGHLRCDRGMELSNDKSPMGVKHGDGVEGF